MSSKASWQTSISLIILILSLASRPALAQSVQASQPAVPIEGLAGMAETGGEPAAPPKPVASPKPVAPAQASSATSGEATFDALIQSTFANPVGMGTDKASQTPTIKVINDPVEPMNRAFFSFNDGFISWIVNPVEKGYKVIIPEPGRKGLRKVGNNLGYPVRLLSTLFQGEFVSAASETGRFLVNTTVGLLGFYDPASHIGMKGTNADFGQTFSCYGAGSGPYIVLPFIGPSSGRDTLAWPFNAVSDLKTWIPGGSIVFGLNDMSFTLAYYNQMMEVERDPYATARDLWSLKRQGEVINYEIKAEKNDPLPTLGAIFLNVKDPLFPTKGQKKYAWIPTTGKALPYSLWLQDHPAPLVFVMAGVGSHRVSQSALAIAEMAYKHDCSVVTISSAMNWEFMEAAGTAAVPGYTPEDARDVYVALDAIYQDLRVYYPDRITSKAVMGLSMGALHTLFISSFEMNRPAESLHFDRYVAINPPVDIVYALNKLDEYYNAPMEWKKEERKARMENTLLKAIKLAEGSLTPSLEQLPFDSIESRYLIGLNFRWILRDIIYSSQKRENLGVIHANFNKVSRQEVYDQIAGITFIDYIRAFVLPYYLYHPGFEVPRKQFIRESNLWYLENELKQNPKVRVYANENDFLLRKADVEWLRTTLGNRLTMFSGGGHLGNLHVPDVQDRIMDALADLKRN